MVFTGHSLATTLLLLGAALGAVVALHFLRARTVRVPVVTTLFWADARSAAVPRTLWHRLRQGLALALLAGAVGLGALACSRAVWAWSHTPARHTVVVMDAGLSMTARRGDGAPSRFDEAKRVALEVAERLGPRDRLAVIAAAERPRVVLRFDDPVAAATHRVRAFEASERFGDSESALRLAHDWLRDRASGRMVWITEPERAARTRPAAHDDVERVTLPVGGTIRNAAIRSICFAATEADAQRGRLVVEVSWDGDAAFAPEVRAVRADTGAVVIDAPIAVDADGFGRVSSPALDADGSTVRVTVSEPEGIPGDNEAEYRLPYRPAITVGADAGVPGALRVAIEATPARVTSVDDPAARLIVTANGDARPAADKASIVVVSGPPDVSAGTPVRFADHTALTVDLDLEHAVSGAGPALALPARSNEIIPLITADGATLAAIDSTSAARRVLLSTALFDADATAPNHPAMAILIARVVRLLAGWSAPAVVVPAQRTAIDPMWVRAVANDRRVVATSAAPLARGSTVPASQAEVPRRATTWMTGGELLLLMVFILMLLEGWLYVRGRIA
jgi:hypothetical protein